jgi:hypothetical protein
MKYQWTRATTAMVQKCNICLDPTNRITAFKKPEEKQWTSVFVCDGCHDGMKTAPERKPGDA